MLPASYSSANNTEYPGGWSVAGAQAAESGGKGSSEVTRRPRSSRDLRNLTTSTVVVLPAGMINPLPDTIAAAVSMYPFVRLITGGVEHNQNDSRTRIRRAEPTALARGRFLMPVHMGVNKTQAPSCVIRSANCPSLEPAHRSQRPIGFFLLLPKQSAVEQVAGE